MHRFGSHPGAREPDPRHPVPLPDGVACYAIAATTAASPGDLRGRLLGDGLVPVMSALGRHKEAARNLNFAPDRQWIACETGTSTCSAGAMSMS